jgi:hypothetical protein
VSSSSAAAHRGSAAARRVAAVVAVEGGLLFLAGAIFGVGVLRGQPADRTTATLGAGLALAVGAGLLTCARGLGRVRTWARSPVVVAQLLALPVGLGLVQAHRWLPAVVVVGLAGAVLGLLAVPTCRSAFRRS